MWKNHYEANFSLRHSSLKYLTLLKSSGRRCFVNFMGKNKIKMKIIYVSYSMVTTILSEKITINHRHKRVEGISQTDINAEWYKDHLCESVSNI